MYDQVVQHVLQGRGDGKISELERALNVESKPIAFQVGTLNLRASILFF